MCHILDWCTRLVSYASVMDDKTFVYRLKIPLIEKDYGDTAAEILRTCALMAEYAQEHTPEQVKAFQEEVGINTQVWSRLIALHKDSRLKNHLECLPASYTALYAISRMQDQEFDAAIQQGVIHPSASSHSILRWTKENRLISGEAVPPWRCLVVFDAEIEKKDFVVMRQRMNQIAQEYDAKLISEVDYVPSDSKEDKTKVDLMHRLEFKIVELATPMYVRMKERQRSRAGVARLEDFLEVDLMTFGAVLRADAKYHEGGKNAYPPLYVYRLALEYLRTDSRSQRFNYKRRLKQLAESQPELAGCIDNVISEYMTEKKIVVQARRIKASSQIPDVFIQSVKTPRGSSTHSD
jgi:hypothetical protein